MHTTEQLAEQLRQADRKDYNRPAAPAVFAEYEAFIATGQYPYIQSVVNFIRARHDLPDDLVVNGSGQTDCGTPLSMEVYLSSTQHRLNKMIEQERELAARGFRPITELVPRNGQKIQLPDGTVYRVVPMERDTALLPPRKRTQGISLNGLVSQHRAFIQAKERGQERMDNPRVRMYVEVRGGHT